MRSTLGQGMLRAPLGTGTSNRGESGLPRQLQGAEHTWVATFQLVSRQECGHPLISYFGCVYKTDFMEML